MLALGYRGQNRLADARAARQDALDAGVGDFRLLMDFGELERSDGQYAAADRMYRQALELQPDNTEAMWKLARSLEGQGQLEEAADVFSRARVLSPDDVLVAKALGDVLTESGHYDKALPLLEEVTQREPDYAWGHYYQAVALERTGRRSEALLSANKAVELEPSEPRYQRLVGSLAQQET